MAETKGNPIREEWEECYKTLEAIRRCGIVNMYGAAPVLRECYPALTRGESAEILMNWMSNYSELSEKFGWRN